MQYTIRWWYTRSGTVQMEAATVDAARQLFYKTYEEEGTVPPSPDKAEWSTDIQGV